MERRVPFFRFRGAPVMTSLESCLLPTEVVDCLPDMRAGQRLRKQEGTMRSRNDGWWSGLTAKAGRFIQPVVDLLIRASESLGEWGEADAPR